MRGNESVRASRSAQAGFTLVELLLAIAISALVAALAYAGLSTAIGASAGMQVQVRQLSDIQRALNILEEDLLQVRPRAITNGFGSQEAAFRGGVFQDALLEFTRGGFGNPQGLARSELQRVRYVLADGRLWRQSWPVLDRVAENQPPQSVLLLENVAAVQPGFLRVPAPNGVPPDFYSLGASNAYWDSDWNSQQLAADAVAPLPVAVNLVLTLTDFGEVRRVFELP
jgi:general secretion pathway protein J